jgi:5S rRNA maturation endonuclease (ribonuclease M5)
MELRQHNKANPVDKYPLGECLQLIAKAEEEMPDFDTPDLEDVLFGKAGLHEFPNWWLDSFPLWHECAFVKQYLAKRGISSEVARQLRLRGDPNQMRVCWPVRDFKGTLRGLHGRAVQDAVEPRYRMYVQAGQKNPIVWLGESWVDQSKPIVVVEGPVDLAKVYQVYRNVVSPLYSNPSIDKLKRMADAFQWVTFFDKGKGGDTGRAKIDNVFGKTHIIAHVLPSEDFKDPGEMGVHDIAEVLDNHVKLDDFLLD